ncbi:MAG: DUF4147 domain-containing protein [Pirellulaceae bacterium]|nr:DUF4147 domain-containing protein [Pirellulaceae bacterium]
MGRSSEQLHDDMLAIWRAGVDAVRSDRLVREHVRVRGAWLDIADTKLRLDRIGRIAVVGGGKAGAGMAQGLLDALGPRLVDEKQVHGWINVPADCVRPGGPITLHAARPAGHNEPTPAGVAGVERILEIIGGLSEDDLCLCLLSGGGSALLPAPPAGVSLADKQQVTRLLSGGGANINELNTVRKQLSRVKGGRLAQACAGGHLVTLVISDVIGDPLDIIASGPTTPDSASPADAIAVLERFTSPENPAPGSVLAALGAAAPAPPRVTAVTASYVIGNNAAAVDAAGVEAERRGYSHAMASAAALEGAAEGVGVKLAQMALKMRDQPGPDCLISGGEPTVTLAPPAIRGSGGRNQQLVLAALQVLLEKNPSAPLERMALMSGGTDGEDGPTDAAGAFIDASVAASLPAHALSAVADHLSRNDAYAFFDQHGGLIRTGPTHTNVCDLRVATVAQEAI